MIVSTPVADMRREPSNRSERLSQVLFGHHFDVLEERDGFCYGNAEDHYQGWINSFYLADTETIGKPDRIVTSRFAFFKIAKTKETIVLPFGALIQSLNDEGQFAYYGLQPIHLFEGITEPSESKSLLNPAHLALTLTGSPYLWGGTSPFGYDCSGLVQAVFRRCGFNLPRDSKDQSQAGEQVQLADARLYDLICFPGHIAIHMGDMRIVHATRRRGMVVVESLRAGETHFRADLIDKVNTVRRMMP